MGRIITEYRKMVHPHAGMGAETVFMIARAVTVPNAHILRRERKTVAAMAPFAAKYG